MAVAKSGASYDHLTIDPFGAMRVMKVTGLGRIVAHQSALTFVVSAAFAPAATPTDMIRIVGSASKVVRVYSIYLGTTNTAAGSQQFFLLKRSSDNTGGTFIMPSVVGLDSKDAATAIAGHYTANPTVGNTIGNINIVRWASPLLAPGNFAGVVKEAGKELMPWGATGILDKFVTLRGADQVLAVNFNGAALVVGQIHTYRVVWTESDL